MEILFKIIGIVIFIVITIIAVIFSNKAKREDRNCR